MSTVTPNYTDNVSVIAAAVLARGSVSRATIDLRAKFGAWIFGKQGRGGATALSGGTAPGVDFLIRRVVNNGGATVGAEHVGATAAFLSSTAAASGNSVVSVDAAAGATSFTVTTITNFAAGDIICIQDAGGGVTRLEWARISKIAGSVITVDAPLTFAHTALQADTVRNKADVYPPVWVQGGSLYEVVFDYGDDTAGESVTIQALAQTYDTDTIA